MTIALRVRFAVIVAILPWLFANILTIGVAALLSGRQSARIWFHFIFLSPHVLLPLIMFVATLVTLAALMRFAKWQS